MTKRSFQELYDKFDEISTKQQIQSNRKRSNTISRYVQKVQTQSSTGFKRMELCRKALDALDGCGFKRSFHQREFHDDFIRACARVFWKTDPPGSFARNHQKILENNGWDTLSQEVLISTPRR